MKIPGPDHPITLEPAGKRWRARFAGHVIADTAHAIVLREAAYQPRIYFPRGDVDMAYLGRTDHTTHCPYKGDAAYYTLDMDGQIAENAVWSYEQPFAAMQAIDGMLSFYTDKVDVYEVDEATVAPRRGDTHTHFSPDASVDHIAELAEPKSDEAVDVDSVVQHTDSGSGASQREHWPPNVSPRVNTDDGGLR
jgi:uncharacterized protein (DUF427 family)